MFEGPTKLIQNSSNITLLTHKDAGQDGDALGSMVSLAFACSKINRESHPFLSDKVASNFLFLPGLDMLDDKFYENTDLLIFLDCADYKRGDFNPKIKKLIDCVPSILIDHHPLGDLSHFVQFKICNLQAAATTELLFFLLYHLGVEIDKEVATALLTGIITDTNSFQNPNTTRKTFCVASNLLSCGARMDEIVHNIFYQKSISTLKLWGKAFSRLYVNNKYNFIISYIREEDLLECQVNKEEVSGIVNFLNLGVANQADIVLFLIEKEGKIKASLRTQKNSIDVSQIAKIFGGGGHQKAAGFEIKGRFVLRNGDLQIE